MARKTASEQVRDNVVLLLKEMDDGDWNVEIDGVVASVLVLPNGIIEAWTYDEDEKRVVLARLRIAIEPV